MIPVHLITRSPHQPRKRFAESSIEELAESLKAQGVLQPVMVRKIPNGYELIAGERRWRAAQRAGLAEIPAVIKDASAEEATVLALVENLQREDLNPMEAAHAFRRLMMQFGLTQEDVARRVHKERSSVANTLRLLQLPEELQQAVLDGRLSHGHAKALLGLDAGMQLALGRRVIVEGLSVRQTEALVGEGARKRRSRVAPVEVADLELRLGRAIGTRVSIVGTARAGQIRIQYASSEELERLLEWLEAGPGGSRSSTGS
jgi:ParB family chromosome partitioning protein